MNISKEVKVGILAVVAIALSFWGYNFIVGKNLLTNSDYYRIVYNNVEGLQVGTPVRISGVEVGSVTGVEFMNNAEKQVTVTITMNNNLPLPKNTEAVIVAVGFMGGKAILLEYGNPCSGSDCAERGAYLTGKSRPMLLSMLGADDLSGYMKDLRDILQGMVDTLLSSNNSLGKTLDNLEGMSANLKSTTAQADQLMRQSSGNIKESIASFKNLAATLDAKKDKIGGIIDNAESVTGQIAESDLKGTMEDVKKTVEELKATLATAQKALDGVSGAVGKIQSGEGTLGKLLNDDGLYYDIKTLSTRADSLLNDIESRPYRYIPLKSRKKVQRYDRLDGKN
ncbi:MAG: MCE family protein [Lewinella sp.]|nr:MCE family protein [Lewinella sp.]